MNLPKTIVFCTLMLTISSFSWPADFYVQTGDVSGLNDAINTANTNDEADTIHLEAGLYSILEYNPQDSQTYFHITSPISILGAGSVRTIIERHADFPFNFFLVDSQGELRLRGVTLLGGDGNQSCGGAIRMEGGKLAVEFSTISNNYSRFHGGGICNHGGTLTVDHGVFTGNTANYNGGAVHNEYDAIATINNSAFRNNQAGSDGGALYNNRSELFITGSTISANSATGAGGGVSSSSSGVSSSTTIDITSTTINGNTAGFDGGGLYLHSSNSTIRKSTISNNFSGNEGGGVWGAFGSRLISNTTISGNRANSYGGGVVQIESSGSVTLNNVTVAFNVADYDGDGIGLGGGVANGPESRTTFSNTIIAGNRVNLDASECTGTLSSGGHNLLQVVTPDCIFNPLLNIIGEDPLLGPLTNNGGLTDTHALAPGSPAINAGGPGSCEETDQRGVSRNCDIGAYELGVLPPDPSFKTNSGLNDAWYNPATSGQGFFITVFPNLGAASLAWFTYDTESPPLDAVANLGDPGHRWITAIGPITGNQVLMNIDMTSGGLFDTATEISRTDPPGSDGTIMLEFSSCNRGTVTYDIPSINRQGIVPIQRVAGDNIALCEAHNAN